MAVVVSAHSVLAAEKQPSATSSDPPGGRIRIYQLFVRLYGNINETRKINGTLAENGVGKFFDINDAALASISALGFTHVWLTGVIRQATGTDYSKSGQPSDDPALLKGIAGSPYAIKDYFDVCPDYAEHPENRLDEFKALIERIHAHQLGVLIDLVPNHVARSYGSDVKPKLDFGKDDDKSKFFAPQNNFFYLKAGTGGPPLRLPRKNGESTVYEPEKEHGRVTGNNVAKWTPSIGDWYETIKLNYGFDFTAPNKDVREYPNPSTPDKAIPDTWKKMDEVLKYWQLFGVDGFRCDMAHMEPPEFWTWAIQRARERNGKVVFVAEAYDNDPAKVPATGTNETNCMVNLLKAGFTGVYDDPTYRAIKKIYEGPGWANDIDTVPRTDLIFENSLRYAENHDEVRLASKNQWHGLGMNVGLPVSAILYGLSRGPILLYNGQEVGEPGAGSEGFGGDDSRTSIFDYWSMPEFTKWVNNHQYDGGKLSDAQKQLREGYGKLINLVGEPAFKDGIFIPLNASNRDNPNFGRIGSESPSGHWLYAFVRYDRITGQRFLAAVNLHPKTLMGDVRVRLSDSVVRTLGLDSLPRETHLNLRDRLVDNEPAATGCSIAEAVDPGIPLDELPPLTAQFYEITIAKSTK